MYQSRVWEKVLHVFLFYNLYVHKYLQIDVYISIKLIITMFKEQTAFH